jgi:[calcium/calmodulin-dependent protein kinase] kinase
VIDDAEQDKLYLVMEFVGRGAILSKTFFESKSSLILDAINDDDKGK